jgi:hypothetical protein
LGGILFSPLNGPDELDIAVEREMEKVEALYAEIPGEELPVVPFDQDAYDRVWKAIEAKLNADI